ncbi:unnamed protein product [Hermetia illucens]|uniref:Hexosyltransferase n=1 Tax=Hermetia illucens TaxID=343691 RepID=A0A7R8V9Q8_HERIL|nr:unnamed protein product [Hermetia illucens]
MALQQNRILRFLMVLTAVLLTIFIYASYYSNTVMTLPARLHASASTTLSLSANVQKQHAKNIVGGNAIIITDKGHGGKILQQLNNDELNNTMYRLYTNESAARSSSPIISNAITNFNQKHFDVLPNVTSNSSSSGVALTSNMKVLNVTAANPLHAKTKTITNANQIDPLKGVRTGDIYESGYQNIDRQLCAEEGAHIKLLVLITSAPKNQEARLAIRQTWGHYGTRRDVAVAFVLGRTTSQQMEDTLNAESSLYSDLIRGQFIDSYNNLTLKTVSILEWVDRFCPKALFINIVTISELYMGAVYPQFTTGPAYLITSDVIHDLYLKSLEQTYLKLEDVYTTGIVAQLLNIKRVHVNEFLNRRIAFNPCNIRKAISVHMIKSNEQFDLWKKLLDTSAKCK